MLLHSDYITLNGNLKYNGVWSDLDLEEEKNKCIKFLATAADMLHGHEK